MKTVFIVEWKHLCRSRVHAFLLLFFMASGIYAIYYGTSVVRKQKSTIEALQHAYSSKIEESIAAFEADTSKVEGKSAYRNASQPSYVSALFEPPAVFDPNSFSALAIGQRDILPFYKEVSTSVSFSQTYDASIANPEVLAIGNFDLSFVIIYLMPLFLIALGHNVISQEKEQGTLPMLRSQAKSLHRILLFKLFFRVLVVFFSVHLLNGIAFLWSGMLIPLKAADVFNWVLVVSCYLIFWSAICYLIISFKKSSSITAIYLSACWLLLVIVMPFFLNFYIDLKHPMGIQADMASEQRRIEEDVWELRPKELIYDFYKRHPEYKKGNYLTDTLQYSTRRFIAYYDEREIRLMPIYKKKETLMNDRSELMGTLLEYNPILKAQKMLNQIGRSDRASFRQFESSALLFQKKWQAYLYHLIFADQELKAADYKTLPKYQYIQTEGQAGIWLGCIELILLSMIPIVVRFYVQKRMKPH